MKKKRGDTAIASWSHLGCAVILHCRVPKWRALGNTNTRGVAQMGIRRAAQCIGASALVLAGLGSFSASAFAAGTGYSGSGTGGSSGTTGSPGAPAGFTSVLTTETIQPSGGAVSAGGVTVNIPNGDFTVPTQVSILEGTNSALTGLPSGVTPVISFGIVFMQDGSKVTGTFPSPIPVTITNSAVTSTDQVLTYDSATGTYVPASQNPNPIRSRTG